MADSLYLFWSAHRLLTRVVVIVVAFQVLGHAIRQETVCGA